LANSSIFVVGLHNKEKMKLGLYFQNYIRKGFYTALFISIGISIFSTQFVFGQNLIPNSESNGPKTINKKNFKFNPKPTYFELPKDTFFLAQIMRSQPHKFSRILADTEHLEVQILYTQINRDRFQIPHFVQYSYHLNPKYYFYPASTVKLPLVALALEKVNRMRKLGITKFTSFLIDSLNPKQSAENKDTSSQTGYPSIAQYIRRILLVSDNDAYNRLYEFLGPDYINQSLHKKGYTSARIMHRFDVSDDSLSERQLNPWKFMKNQKVLWEQKGRLAEKAGPNEFENTLKGTGYIQYSGKDSVLIKKPFDFSNKNGISLEDEQNILKAILFPNSVKPSHRFNLTSEDYLFLQRYLSMYPAESKFPHYSKIHYPDNYCKFLGFGSDSAINIPSSIRIFNKVGLAYGFLIDNAYFVDFNHHVEFLLSVVINSNTDGIYNDDRYEYSNLGFPFMRNLGQTIYDFELKRSPKYSPKLEKFKLDYKL
jgi:hypothetical protein